MRFDGFNFPSYSVRSPNVDAQKCINLYAELHELGNGKERERYSLIGTPGLSTLLTLAGGVFRGCLTASNGQLFAVGGTKLYRISSTWAATELGTLNTSTGPISMADNGLQVMIVDGPNGYVWTIGSATFAQITDEDFPGANQVSFVDGYFIFDVPNSGQFMITGLTDVTVDALDIATSEGKPDPLRGHIALNREILMLNEKSGEVFYNTGNADFPFERVQGGFFETGCAARFSVAKGDGNVFFLGQDENGTGIVYVWSGGATVQRISTHAVEFSIRQFTDFSDAEGYCYQEEGHLFYVLNFPTGDTTWCFDLSTKFWHERNYSNDGALERHRGRFHAFAHGKHIVGDYANGKIYELSSSIYTDAGAPITRRRRSPHVSANGKRVQYKEFLLDIETGVGLDGATSTQGNDPQVMLRFSKDGGHTWSNEKWKSFGKIGERYVRPKWNNLGMARDMIFDITITDPVKVVIVGADLELERMAS